MSHLKSNMNNLLNISGKLLIGAAIALPGLVSCSIKEDRIPCPCYLEVSFEDREHIKDPVSLTGWTSEQMFDVDINTVDYPDTYTQKVEKTMIAFGAAEGMVSCRQDGHFINVPLGCECDSLYAFIDNIDCTGEMAYTTVKFHKQFATVYLNIGKSSSQMKDYSFVVESNSCGFDMLTYDGVEGEFRCEPETLNGNVIQFRLPRQVDDGLSVTVRYSGGQSASFPLGTYIRKIGYNWSAEDLQDIFITLDIVNGKISVGVADWENAEDFDLSHVEL